MSVYEISKPVGSTGLQGNGGAEPAILSRYHGVCGWIPTVELAAQRGCTCAHLGREIKGYAAGSTSLGICFSEHLAFSSLLMYTTESTKDFVPVRRTPAIIESLCCRT
jgi:hypothetical protein